MGQRGGARQRTSKSAGTKAKLFKIQKSQVERMVKNFDTLKKQLEKAYPGYEFLDAEVKYNGINAAFYIYARMVRN